VQFAVGYKIQGKTGHVVVDSEDALIAALKVSLSICLEIHWRMRAVAERLVLRRTAAVDGHVAALFVLMTVIRGHH